MSICTDESESILSVFKEFLAYIENFAYSITSNWSLSSNWQIFIKRTYYILLIVSGSKDTLLSKKHVPSLYSSEEARH